MKFFIFAGFLVLVYLLLVCVTVLREGSPLDSTDNPDTRERSGMTILVDHGTGCQYLTRRGGGITPRLDKDGQPMCGVNL